MICWLVILGLLGWLSSPRDKQVDIPESVDSDAYSGPVDIPEFYKAIPVLEPDNTPLIADAYVRAGGDG